MIDVEKQIIYRAESGEDDLATAKYLYEGNRFIQCLFFCHLSIEKVMKAHVTKFTKDLPEKTHNLNKLLLKTPLDLNEKQKELLGILMVYQLLKYYFELFPYINLSQLAKKINLNPSLIRQYHKGLVMAGESQFLKIRQGLHSIGKELGAIV